MNTKLSHPKSDNKTFRHRIGYWWSDKKAQKFNPVELAELFAKRDCEFVKINLDRPIDEQGPYSVIVHKISDIIVKADQGDPIAKKMINAFESFARKNPQTIILDPLDNNRSLLDRYKQYRLIEQSVLAKEGVLFTPPFVHLTSTNLHVNRGRVRLNKLTYPLVCKPILAQGSQVAHQMCIIFNEAGLKDVKPPCVVQSFVNHNAKLFKLFVIKNKYYIMERPSLKNFRAGNQDTVFFFSHDISKPNSSSSLTELDEADKLKMEQLISKMNLDEASKAKRNMVHTVECQVSDYCDRTKDRTTIASKHNNLAESLIEKTTKDNSSNELNIECAQDDEGRMLEQLWPSKDKLDRIVQAFSEKLNLTFYGLDIIIENDTSRYAIIDMNTFPGYDGIDNILNIFTDVVYDSIPKQSMDTDQLKQIQQSNKINKRRPNEIDSGIEST